MLQERTKLTTFPAQICDESNFIREKYFLSTGKENITSGPFRDSENTLTV